MHDNIMAHTQNPSKGQTKIDVNNINVIFADVTSPIVICMWLIHKIDIRDVDASFCN